MPREEYNPNDFLDQLAALSEVAVIQSLSSNLDDPRARKIFDATIHICNKYGIKGFDAIRFMNELTAIIMGIEGLDGDKDG